MSRVRGGLVPTRGIVLRCVWLTRRSVGFVGAVGLGRFALGCVRRLGDQWRVDCGCVVVAGRCAVARGSRIVRSGGHCRRKW